MCDTCLVSWAFLSSRAFTSALNFVDFCSQSANSCFAAASKRPFRAMSSFNVLIEAFSSAAASNERGWADELVSAYKQPKAKDEIKKQQNVRKKKGNDQNDCSPTPMTMTMTLMIQKRKNHQRQRTPSAPCSSAQEVGSAELALESDMLGVVSCSRPALESQQRACHASR